VLLIEAVRRRTAPLLYSSAVESSVPGLRLLTAGVVEADCRRIISGSTTTALDEVQLGTMTPPWPCVGVGVAAVAGTTTSASASTTSMGET
jgi:hypothetical protein